MVFSFGIAVKTGSPFHAFSCVCTSFLSFFFVLGSHVMWIECHPLFVSEKLIVTVLPTNEKPLSKSSFGTHTMRDVRNHSRSFLQCSIQCRTNRMSFRSALNWTNEWDNPRAFIGMVKSERCSKKKKSNALKLIMSLTFVNSLNDVVSPLIGMTPFSVRLWRVHSPEPS